MASRPRRSGAMSKPYKKPQVAFGSSLPRELKWQNQVPDYSKPKPKLAFGSSLPREFKWQNQVPDYSKPKPLPKREFLKKKDTKVKDNPRPFARPGETRSQELMRVGKAICAIPLKSSPRSNPNLRVSRQVKRQVFKAIYGSSAGLEDAKEYLWELRQFERRPRPHYREDDGSDFPKLTARVIEECLKVGVDFGLVRVKSDSDLAPGIYRQRYGKEDVFEEEIIIIEKLRPKEVEALRSKPRRELIDLVGRKYANLNDDLLGETVIMLPLPPKKVVPKIEEEEEEESETEMLFKVERICRPNYHKMHYEDDSDLPPIIRKMKRPTTVSFKL